jgi:hypothetical protein
MRFHPDDKSDAGMRRHYAGVLVFEALFVALLWALSRTFA